MTCLLNFGQIFPGMSWSLPSDKCMLTLRRTPFGYYENGSKPVDSTHGTHSLQLITSFWDALRGFCNEVGRTTHCDLSTKKARFVDIERYASRD